MELPDRFGYRQHAHHLGKDGKKYVTVTSGTGGAYPLFSGDARLKNVPAGGSVWTFMLK